MLFFLCIKTKFLNLFHFFRLVFIEHLIRFSQFYWNSKEKSILFFCSPSKDSRKIIYSFKQNSFKRKKRTFEQKLGNIYRLVSTSMQQKLRISTVIFDNRKLPIQTNKIRSFRETCKISCQSITKWLLITVHE